MGENSPNVVTLANNQSCGEKVVKTWVEKSEFISQLLTPPD
jgi:hypothetical protein